MWCVVCMLACVPLQAESPTCVVMLMYNGYLRMDLRPFTFTSPGPWPLSTVQVQNDARHQSVHSMLLILLFGEASTLPQPANFPFSCPDLRNLLQC